MTTLPAGTLSVVFNNHLSSGWLSWVEFRTLEAAVLTLLKFLKIILEPAFPELLKLLLNVLIPAEPVNREVSRAIFREVCERFCNKKNDQVARDMGTLGHLASIQVFLASSLFHTSRFCFLSPQHFLCVGLK
jgi:hypothetical protein